MGSVLLLWQHHAWLSIGQILRIRPSLHWVLCHMLARRLAQATGEFLTLYEGLSKLGDSSRVTASWFILESNPRPVGSVMPRSVSVQPAHGLEAESSVWKQRSRAPPRHRPHRHGAGGAPAADAGDEEMSDHEEPDPMNAGGDEDEVVQAEQALANLLDEAQELAEEGFLPGDVDPPGAEADAAASGDQIPGGGAGPADLDAQAAPPAPPVPHDAAPDGGRRRGAAEVTYYVPGGSISFYASKMAYQAVCENREHARCVLTRTCHPRGLTAAGLPKGGRPVGFLVAWLSHSEQCATKADHWSPERLDNPLALRAALRDRIAATPSGRHLLSFERPLVPGETAEPEELDGYL